VLDPAHDGGVYPGPGPGRPGYRSAGCTSSFSFSSDANSCIVHDVRPTDRRMSADPIDAAETRWHEQQGLAPVECVRYEYYIVLDPCTGTEDGLQIHHTGESDGELDRKRVGRPSREVQKAVMQGLEFWA